MSWRILVVTTAALVLTACKTAPPVGSISTRLGDEIMVAGQLVHTGTRVVLWVDPEGYDAYRVERRFSPLAASGWETSKAEVKELTTPNRYGLRREGLSESELAQVRGGGWDLATLRKVVDQFVLHYDACGTSRQCFKVLHDQRDLSVHFMLDLDGTIYQTLDLKERAWHATTSNSRSVGIEIANIGAFGSREHSPLPEWYESEANGRTRVKIPARFGDGGLRIKGFVAHPARPEPIEGEIQGQTLNQYDFTPEQYDALVHLTATLCKVFPKLKCDCPKDPSGHLVRGKLPTEELSQYEGVLGHFHVQTDKVDPGPAFQWDRLINQAQMLLDGGFSNMANQTSLGHMRSRE